MTAFGSRVTVPQDSSAATWIGARLGAFGSVGGLLPDGFARSALVRLPLADEGEAAAEHVAAIAGLAARHTTTPEAAWFAIWEGYGWTSTTHLFWPTPAGPIASVGRSWRRRRLRIADQRRHEIVRRGLARVPTFELPHRRYHLVHGPLAAVAELEQPGSTAYQPPDLWWPDDRRWFVAGDTDLDWTYVGGPAELIDQLLEHFGTRARPVDRQSRNDEFS